MLYLLNGFVTTWVCFVLPLVAYNYFDFNLHRYGWLMVGVSATATVASLSMSQVSKSRCMANSINGDWRVLVMSYTVMITAIVISYLGGPSVGILLIIPLDTCSGLGFTSPVLKWGLAWGWGGGGGLISPLILPPYNEVWIRHCFSSLLKN